MARSDLPTAFVSDAMPTVGAEHDHFELMGRQIQPRHGRPVSEDGTLDGLITNWHLLSKML
jgi:N-acetylglucosamine-6-phosphate deacetylase